MPFRNLAALFFIFNWSLIYGQQSASIKINIKTEKYHVVDTCFYTLKWNTLKLTNKKAENTINKSIKNEVYKYIKNERYKLESLCDNPSTVSYDFKCNVVFANKNVVSVSINSLVNNQNGGPGEDDFKTINYNTKSGAILNFNNLIRKDKISAIDTLLIHKMKAEMAEYEESYGSEEIQHWKQQLNNLDFTLSENGITIIITNYRGGYNGNSWKQELWFDYEEIKDFLLNKELLKYNPKGQTIKH
jgi:hypothetical protein